MSISNPARRITYAGGDLNIPVSFMFFLNSHVRVTKIGTTGTQTALVENVNYTLSGAGNMAGGVLSLTGPALVGGETLVIERLVPPLQPVDITNQGEVFPVQFEAGLDYLAQIAGQVEDLLGLYDTSKAKVPKLEPNTTDGSSAYDARSNRIANLDEPTLPQDAATRNYVDAAVSSAGGGSGGGGGASDPLQQFNNAPPTADVTWKNRAVAVRFTGTPNGPTAIMICLEGLDGAYAWYTYAAAMV